MLQLLKEDVGGENTTIIPPGWIMRDKERGWSWDFRSALNHQDLQQSPTGWRNRKRSRWRKKNRWKIWFSRVNPSDVASSNFSKGLSPEYFGLDLYTWWTDLLKDKYFKIILARTWMGSPVVDTPAPALSKTVHIQTTINICNPSLD